MGGFALATCPRFAAEVAAANAPLPGGLTGLRELTGLGDHLDWGM